MEEMVVMVVMAVLRELVVLEVLKARRQQLVPGVFCMPGV
jgi:hypothetical protein